MREIFCAPCDATFKSRAEHLRLVKPDSWLVKNVPIVKPVRFEEVKDDGGR